MQRYVPYSTLYDLQTDGEMMMKRRIGVGALFMLALTWMVPATATADVVVHDPWIREAPPMVQTLAAYMTLENKGKQAVKLVKAASPAFAKVEVHQTIHKNNMAMMEQVHGLEIKPGEKVLLKPGGYHLMLIAPLSTQRLMAGQRTPVYLSFSDGSEKTIQAEVRRGVMMGGGMDHSQHGMQKMRQQMQHQMHQMHQKQNNMPGMGMGSGDATQTPRGPSQNSMRGFAYPSNETPPPYRYR
ncbi:MAG: copper chaperone PCu(A)C [Magnetococcales bacterium]|nr:copper chaperone PCu(A)C [Magnetococcales bacterium]